MMMKLLLVDDDQFLRDMYALKFKDSGYEVEVADGPAEALRIIEQDQKFDVVLLDMVMPTMSGLELMKEINQIFPDMKTKYIVLSNQGQSEDIAQAKKEGAVGYIIKAESIPSDVVKKVEELSN
jgi:CheY-like chemotaxis protein